MALSVPSIFEAAATTGTSVDDVNISVITTNDTIFDNKSDDFVFPPLSLPLCFFWDDS